MTRQEAIEEIEKLKSIIERCNRNIADFERRGRNYLTSPSISSWIKAIGANRDEIQTRSKRVKDIAERFDMKPKDVILIGEDNGHSNNRNG